MSANDIGHGDMCIGPADADGPPLRLLRAFARGETTDGGMAEAGWFCVGRITDDGIIHTPDINED